MNRYKDLPVLVTGGCGFIGSHLATRLVELGAQVTIVDDLSSGSLDNIAAIKDKVTVMPKSITDMDACLQVARGKQIIFHLAAFISVPQSMEDPSLCHRTNIDGTFNLLEAARLQGVQRFVFSSSAAVYGPTSDTCTETMPCCPTSPYGYAKWIGEIYCQQFARVFGLKTICMRYFNVYGERQNPNGQYAAVVAKFKHCMENNKPITMFGDGKQTRDFVPVHKVVEANLRLALLENEMMTGQVFNIATGKSITLLELADTVKKEYPAYTGATVYKPERAGDIRHSSADCSKYFSL